MYIMVSLFRFLVLEFKEDDLKKATDGFSKSRNVGRGGFGDVYRGYVHGSNVAIKILTEVRSVHNIPELPTVTNITASTMVRAKETAEIIGKEFPNLAIELDSILEEGNPDGKVHRNRFEAVFKKYFVPASSTTKETNIIVCHGNLIRYIICRYRFNLGYYGPP